MAAEVIIMPSESTELHPDWQNDWDALATALVRRAANGEHSAIEVYLCLIGDDRFGDNRRRLERLYLDVRDHTWCSKLYLVVDPLVDAHPEQLASLSSRKLWLDSSLRGGVDDILLAPLERLSQMLP